MTPKGSTKRLVCGECGNQLVHFPEREKSFRICFRCGGRIFPPEQHLVKNVHPSTAPSFHPQAA